MTASYSIVVQNAYGVSVDNWTNVVELTYNRTFNRKGALIVTLPDILKPEQISRDFRLYVYRSVDSGLSYLDTEAMWLVRKVEYEYDKAQWIIRADDPLSVLERRLVAYTPGTPYADKTQERWDEDAIGGSPPVADDMIKMYVTENTGSDAIDSDRDLSAHMSFEAWEGLGATVEKEAGWQNLLTTISDIATQSASAGTPIYFDIITRPDGSLHFMTFTNLRGVDRGSSSLSPLAFYPGTNISNLKLEWDWTKEKNYVYAGGVDNDEGRLIVEGSDADRIAASPWNRNEMFLDLSNASDESAYIPREIEEALYGARPKLTVTGNPVDIPGTQYGVDYFYGDVVLCNVLGYKIDCTIDSVTVKVSGGKEVVDTRLKGEITL